MAAGPDVFVAFADTEWISSVRRPTPNVTLYQRTNTFVCVRVSSSGVSNGQQTGRGTGNRSFLYAPSGRRRRRFRSPVVRPASETRFVVITVLLYYFASPPPCLYPFETFMDFRRVLFSSRRCLFLREFLHSPGISSSGLTVSLVQITNGRHPPPFARRFPRLPIQARIQNFNIGRR